jgi:hypothetical protein
MAQFKPPAHHDLCDELLLEPLIGTLNAVEWIMASSREITTAQFSASIAQRFWVFSPVKNIHVWVTLSDGAGLRLSTYHAA